MLSNYLAVPTDCPQRDERQGWSADTQVFAPAGCYLANVDGFLTKWMQDLTDSIEPATGSFPFVAPFPHTSDNHLGPSTGWSDAGIVVPHVLYRMFGNVDVLKRHFAAMDRFMDVIARIRFRRIHVPTLATGSPTRATATSFVTSSRRRISSGTRG